MTKSHPLGEFPSSATGCVGVPPRARGQDGSGFCGAARRRCPLRLVKWRHFFPIFKTGCLFRRPLLRLIPSFVGAPPFPGQLYPESPAIAPAKQCDWASSLSSSSSAPGFSAPSCPLFPGVRRLTLLASI